MSQLKAKGYGHEIAVENGLISIHHNAMTAVKGVKDVTIPITSVAEVKLGKANFISNGFLAFSVILPDGSKHEGAETGIQAGNDLYAIIFTKKHTAEVEAIYEAVISEQTTDPVPLPQKYMPPISEPDEPVVARQIKVGRNGIVSLFTGMDGRTTRLYIDRVQYKGETKSLDGVSARVESGSDIQSRVTVTRLVAFGIFALAAKKKKGGEKFLTIEGPDFVWAIEAGRNQIADAMRFAAMVNDVAKKFNVGHATNNEKEIADSRAPGVADQLNQLADLRAKGILSAEEFEEAKRKVLNN